MPTLSVTFPKLSAQIWQYSEILLNFRIRHVKVTIDKRAILSFNMSDAGKLEGREQVL